MNDWKCLRTLLGTSLALVTGTPVLSQTAIPVRALPAPITVSTDSLGYQVAVRPLSDGRVLVDDVQHFRVLLYDRNFKSYTTVLDSSALKGSLSTKFVSVNLIPMPGDSTLYVDMASRSLLLLDPDGKVAHVTALPKPGETINLAIGSMYGTPALDARGRLLYRGSFPGDVYMSNVQMMTKLEQQVSFEAPSLSDSAPIVRVDLDARSIDTLATVKIPQGERHTTATRDNDGNMTRTIAVNPFDTGDAWALLPNGTIAILREHDYHIDWVDARGARRSTPKMPFDWKRLTDDDKQRKIDSMKPRYVRLSASQPVEYVRTPNGMRKVTTVVEVIALKEMSDYEPPISPGAMKVDLQGNLWIVPRTAITDGTAGLRYDVVNAKGELFERVTVPKGRAIIAFEAGDTIILGNNQRGVTTLERVRLK